MQRVHGPVGALPRWLLVLLLSAAAVVAPSASALSASVSPAPSLFSTTRAPGGSVASSSAAAGASARPTRERPSTAAADQLSRPRPAVAGGSLPGVAAVPASAPGLLLALACLGLAVVPPARRRGRTGTPYRGRGPPAGRTLLAT